MKEKEITERITSYREMYMPSVAVLCRQLGISTTVYYKMKQGKFTLSGKTYDRIDRFLKARGH